MSQTRERNIILEWSDVKHKFINCVEKGERWDTQPMGVRLAEMHANPYEKVRRGSVTSWEGGNGSMTLGWLREGFHAPEFAHSADYVPQGMKRRASWNDEDGEADPGRLLGGYDKFFLASEERESKPGLRLMIEFAFASGVSNKTIQDYGAWVAGLLGALESSGYDLTVDLWIPLDNLYEGDRGIRSNVLVRVKRENEVSDFTEWSAIFSPTGYRHLGFTAKCVAGDKIGKRANSTLGITLGGRKWGIDYDRQNATVRITVAQRGGYGGEDSAFPKDRLNEEAKAAGLL